MREKSLTGAQVLARMKRGDLPYIRGGYTEKSGFDDGRWASGQVMRRLRKSGKVDPPAHSSVHSPWTLPKEENL